MKYKVITIIFLIITFIIAYFIVKYNSPTLYELSSDELKWLFKNKKAKYLSKHNINTHYIIIYNDDQTFTNNRYISNIKSETSYGTYSIGPNGICNIFYEHVSPSLNHNSIFNPMHPNHSSLTNYTIGPFYLIDKMNIYDYNDDSSATNVYYKCKYCNNMLTFYPK